MPEQRRLDFATPGNPVDPLLERDRAARLLATDPRRNVALEASAGKTGVAPVAPDSHPKEQTWIGSRASQCR